MDTLMVQINFNGVITIIVENTVFETMIKLFYDTLL